MKPCRHHLPNFILLAIIYTLLAKASLDFFSIFNGNVSLVWPSSGFALAMLLIGGTQYWPSIFVGAFTAGLIQGDSFWLSVFIAAGNTLEPLIAWWLLSSNKSFTLALGSTKDFVKICVFGGISAISSAVIGATALLFAGTIPSSALPTILLNWWQGDTLGILLITPLILVWRTTPQGWFSRERAIETAAGFGLLLLIGLILLTNWLPDRFTKATECYWMFLSLTWIALHFGVHGVTFALVTTSFQALWGAAHGVGYFAQDFENSHLFNFWLYQISLSCVSILLALALREREFAFNQSKELEARWRFAIEGSGDGMWDWNIADDSMFLTKHWREMLGLDEHEVGSSIDEWKQRIHPDDKANTLAILQSYFDGKIANYLCEHRVLSKDGSYKWIRDRGMVTSQSDDGKPLRMIGMYTDITDRKQMVVALQESEDRFRNLANAAPVLIWVAGTDKLCTWFNDTWLEYTGRTYQQEVGNGWTEGVFPDDLDRCLEIYITHFDARQPFQMEYRLRGHDGEYHWFIDVGRPRVDGQGEFVGFIGMLTDINNRKLMEQSMRIAQFSLDHAEEEIYWITSEARIVDANALACKALGYSKEELIRLNVTDIDPVFQTKNWSLHWQELKEKGSLRFESAHRTREGKIYPVEVLANYFEYEGDEYRCAFTRNITERKNAEAKLKEKEERLSLATLYNGIGIWDWNLETLELIWDDSMFALYNIRREDFSGTAEAWEKSLHPNDRERMNCEVEDALSGRKPYDTEFQVVWPNGEIRHIKTVAKVFRDGDGKPLRMLGTNLDITERKHLEDELKRQTRTDFLTGLSSRGYFMEQGELELSRAIRYDNPLTIFMMDVDYFKRINDGHGHKVGDTVLKNLAQVCSQTLRDVDIVGRLGGEEFAILLPETAIDEAAEVAERLREAIAISKVLLSAGDQPLHFTVSIGVASLKSKGDNLGILLNLADKALYEAKNSGRNKVSIAN
jgi:diguanylate cyclase (GGDEF)-like protein/PAS domain S-box-containing protein